MLSDPITLYKLMILYMLDHVNFPLTNSQLTDFFLDHEYTTYFTLQQALNELKEAGLIRMESTHNSSRYEITREGEVGYFLQPTRCGGQVFEAKVGDYLARYDVPAREATDVRWAQTCLALEDRVEALEALFEPVFLRRMQQKLWQALYYQYEITQPFLPQLEKNLVWLEAELEKLSALQRRRNARFDESIEKIER